MAKMKFNWKFVLVLLLAIIVLLSTAYFLRKWGISTKAENAIVLGNQAYEQGRWREAAENLGKYISRHQDDVDVLLKYADAQLKIRPLKRGNIQHAVKAYRNVLRADKANPKAAKNLVELYLAISAPGEAEFIAEQSLKVKHNSDIASLHAIALARQGKYQQAYSELRYLLTNHPDYLLAYDALGQIVEKHPDDYKENAEFWFNQLVKNNPASVQAYYLRASYYLRMKNSEKAMIDLDKAQQMDLPDNTTKLHLASVLVNANLMEQAENLLEDIKNSDHDNPDLWKIWATLALNSNDKEKMVHVAEQGLKELHAKSWDFLPSAVELFIKSDRIDRASECIDQMKKIDFIPRDLAYYEGLLAKYKNQGTKAVEQWRRAVQLGDKSVRLRLSLAQSLASSGDKPSALKLLRELVADEPENITVRLALARLLKQMGNWTETYEHARKAQEISHDSVDAASLSIQARMQMLIITNAEFNSPDWLDLQVRLSKLTEKHEDNLSVSLLQFRLHLLSEKYEKAGNLLDELKKKHHPNLRIPLARADLLGAQGNNDQAIAILREAVKDFPDSASPIRGLALMLDHQGKTKQCETLLRNALQTIKNQNTKREFGLLLANFYQKWGQDDQAYKLLRSINEERPDDLAVKYQLLKCNTVANDNKIAQDVIDQIKELEGTEGWRWQYEQAKLWFRQNNFQERYPEIVSMLKKILQANPADFGSRILLAGAHSKAGQLQLALSTYRQVYNRSPQNLAVIIPFITALNKAGQYDEAAAILEQASQKNLSHPILTKLRLEGHLAKGQLDPGVTALDEMIKNNPENMQAKLLMAVLKTRQKKYDDAQAILNELKSQQPDSMPVIVAQIELSLVKNNPDQAINLCDQLVKIHNNSPAFLIRARLLNRIGKNDLAAKDYEHVVNLEPENINAWIQKSFFHLTNNQPKQALNAINTALKLDPDNLKVQKRAIGLYLGSENKNIVQQGNALLEKAYSQNPKDVELCLIKAHLLIAENKKTAIVQAKKILIKLTEEIPELVEPWMLLSDLSLKSGKFGTAIDLALRGLVYAPNNKKLLMLKARAEGTKSPALAISTLKVLRELDPNDPDIAVMLANAQLVAGNADNAITLLKKQLDSCSQNDAHQLDVALAGAMYKSGQKDQAMKKLDSLIIEQEIDYSAIIFQARLLSEDQRWDVLLQKLTKWYKAVPDGDNMMIVVAKKMSESANPVAKKSAYDIIYLVLKKNPHNTEALQVLAMIMLIENKSSESKAVYQQILEIEPENLPVINNLAWILCEHENRLQEALKLANRGLKIDPDFIDLIDTRGVICFRLGLFDKAAKDFKKCISMYSPSAPAIVGSYFHLGRTLAQLGEKNEAGINLKKALELNQRIGGMSDPDVNEAQRLCEKLL